MHQLGVHDHSDGLDNDSNDNSNNSGINNIGSIVVSYSDDESEGARRSRTSLTTPKIRICKHFKLNETTPSPESVAIDGGDVKTNGRMTFSTSLDSPRSVVVKHL